MFLLFIHGSKKAAGDGVFCGFDAVFGPHQILHQALRYTHVLGEILINSNIYSMELWVFILLCSHNGVCHSFITKPLDQLRAR